MCSSDLGEDDAAATDAETSEQEGEDNQQGEESGEGAEGAESSAQSMAGGESRETESAEGAEAAAEESDGEQEVGMGEDGPERPGRRMRPNGPFTNQPDEPSYRAFTTAFDEIVEADQLCDADELTRLRLHLDQQLGHLQGVIGRLDRKSTRLNSSHT